MEITVMSETKACFLRERRWREATIHSKDPKGYPSWQRAWKSIHFVVTLDYFYHLSAAFLRKSFIAEGTLR
jgi:hypothetical protein